MLSSHVDRCMVIAGMICFLVATWLIRKTKRKQTKLDSINDISVTFNYSILPASAKHVHDHLYQPPSQTSVPPHNLPLASVVSE